MSKAFTKEDESPESTPSRAKFRFNPGGARYITAEGFGRLQAELSSLESLPPSQRSAQVLARIGLLQELLGLLTVAEPSSDNERVYFGSWVEVEDEDGGRSVYRLVGPDETDASSGLISVDGPLARALLGRSAGESIEARLPRGLRELTVVSIRNRSQAECDSESAVASP